MRAAVYEQAPGTMADAAGCLKNLGVEAAPWGDGSRPDMLLVEESPGWEDAVREAARAGVPAYLVSAAPGFDLYLRAREAGAAGVVARNDLAGELSFLVRKHSGSPKTHAPAPISGKASLWDLRASEDAPARAFPQAESAGLVPAPVRPRPAPSAAGPVPLDRAGAPAGKLPSILKQVVVPYSPKGGVGKTTIAVNLAALWAGELGRDRVVLADFDPSFGNVPAMLGAPVTASILDWAGGGYAEDIKSCLWYHPSGFAVLAGPSKPEDAGAVTAEVADRVLKALCRRFDVVVVDTCPDLRDSTVVALDLATAIFLVTTPDVVAVHDVRKVARTFDLAGIDRSKVVLVVNRTPRRPPVRLSDLLEEMPFEERFVIPEDPAVALETNRGEVPVLSRRARAFTQALAGLASAVVPVRAHSGRRGLLALLGIGGESR
ncbi:MAG: AAA family ATPase [Firmicutes bacterium]|nr:AAA family ATPase [Bacillota bacterium]